MSVSVCWWSCDVTRTCWRLELLATLHSPLCSRPNSPPTTLVPLTLRPLPLAPLLGLVPWFAPEQLLLVGRRQRPHVPEPRRRRRTRPRRGFLGGLGASLPPPRAWRRRRARARTRAVLSTWALALDLGRHLDELEIRVRFLRRSWGRSGGWGVGRDRGGRDGPRPGPVVRSRTGGILKDDLGLPRSLETISAFALIASARIDATRAWQWTCVHRGRVSHWRRDHAS